MVLRVKLKQTRFPTNSLYTPMDYTPLHSISSVCHPWVERLLCIALSTQLVLPPLTQPFLFVYLGV